MERIARAYLPVTSLLTEVYTLKASNGGWQPRRGARPGHCQGFWPITLRMATDASAAHAGAPHAAAGPAQLQLVIIPGNPGNAGYYQQFMQRLDLAFAGTVDCIAVSHLGHDPSSQYGRQVRRSRHQNQHRACGRLPGMWGVSLPKSTRHTRNVPAGVEPRGADRPQGRLSEATRAGAGAPALRADGP